MFTPAKNQMTTRVRLHCPHALSVKGRSRADWWSSGER
jgi:hypothetical protein